MVRVGVVGAAGRMGQEVCRALDAAGDLELVAAIDPGASGTALPAPAGSSRSPLVVGGRLEALVETGTEVVVDFTEAAAARVTLPWCAGHGISAVVGTTGLDREDLAELARLFDGKAANAVVAPNFAIGAVLLVRLCEIVAPHMDGVEIIELHHDRKIDAPSGTAVHTAERVAAARRAAGRGDLGPDRTEHHVLTGARGAEGDGGIRVHSVRLPGLVAHEEVLFGSAGQSLTLRHDTYDRTAFMPGVLLGVREVLGRPGLTVGLETLLGI